MLRLRARSGRGGYLLDISLVLVLMFLAYLYVSKHVSKPPNSKHRLTLHTPQTPDAFVDTLREGGVVHPDHIPTGVIDWDKEAGTRRYMMAHANHDTRLKNLPDNRPMACRDIDESSKLVPVSIIVHFHEFQFYDMKTTVNSIQLFTPDVLVNEIIVVDDGTSLDHVKSDVKVFTEVARKVRLVRNEERLGVTGARTKGTEQAKSDIVVFLDPGVIVSRGWLDPLVQHLVTHEHDVAMPHHDVISDPIKYDYKDTPSNLGALFTWGLAIRMVRLNRTDENLGPVNSVVTRGNAFAVNKKFMKSIGGFDTGFPDKMAGGEILEFSFRVWRCGGSIKEIPCSKVGVLNLHDPVKILSHPNLRRVVELWLKEKGDTIYHNTGMGADVPQNELDSIKKRHDELKNLQCKSTKWFFKEVATYVPRISENTLLTGVLRCKTSSCAALGNDNKIILTGCPGPFVIPTAIFEFQKDGKLTLGEKCVTITRNAYLVTENCQADWTNQTWGYTQSGELVSAKNKLCIMHVTDPDKSQNKRQVTMVQDCSRDKEGIFKTWTFVPM